MSTTTTTTTRDRGDRYGPMEWAQLWETWLTIMYTIAVRNRAVEIGPLFAIGV